MAKIIIAIIGVLLSGLYLANPTAGFVELLPDTIPGIGNLDEVFFSGVFFYSLSMLGINLLPQKKSKVVDGKVVEPK